MCLFYYCLVPKLLLTSASHSHEWERGAAEKASNSNSPNKNTSCALYVSIRQHTSAFVSIRQHTSAYISIRKHTSAYVRIRQHTSAYLRLARGNI
jgi:hypothetical protein